MNAEMLNRDNKKNLEPIKYYLVLEKRPGDYNIIDINRLDIGFKNNAVIGNDLGSIDSFTAHFTESELRKAIVQSNMVRLEYLEGKLKIISDAKHNFKALTKDVFSVVTSFQTSPEEISINFRNKLYGHYKKIMESLFTDKDFIKRMLERFKMALKNNDKELLFRIIAEIPYSKSRLIYFLIYEEEMQKKEEFSLKLEKLKDSI